MKKIALFIFIISSSILYSQTYEMDAVAGQTINTCGGTFYDSGGPSADYSSSENYTVTFCSDQAGSQISFDFALFDLESGWDEIDIYDGVGTSGVQLVSGGSGTILQNQVIESQGSGCLTFVFTSDGSVTHAGWDAAISCTFPCQDFTADIVNTSEPYYSGDTIRLCQNTPLTFTAAGTYPNNNVNYTQDDATSTFHWDFGDGTDTTGVGLTTVSHSFPEGGYYVFLDVTDVNNCDNSNLIMNTVMVSTTPLFTGTDITDTICPGETVSFTGTANTNEWNQPLPAVIGDTTFLPDGSGASYETSLTYNFFTPGATLTNINDLGSICMDLEHSYAGDLQISIICPNGSTMMLFDGYGNSNIGGEYLGEATDYSSTPGTPYTYCWDPTATNGTMEDVGASPPTYSYTDNDGNTVTNHEYIPGGTYESSGNWSNLLGCPLNGDWTIHVIDNMGADDGYIFAWTIDWDTSLTTGLWTFGNTYDSTLYTWSGQNITGQTNGVGTSVPTTTGGTEYYTFSATDDFGCVYDTILPVYIYPTNNPGCCLPPTPNAGVDDSICGLSIQLNATFFDALNNGMWIATGPGNVTFDDATSNTAIATADAFGTYTFTWTEFNPAGCQASDVITINYYDGADISTTTTPTLCFGGSDGTATVVHNTTVDAPYTYAWDNTQTTITATALAATTYNVTVTNVHGCTSTATATVTEPTELTSTTSATDVSCFGGSDGTTTVVAQGGIAPYTYGWSDAASQTTSTATGLPGATYIVQITDANGCTAANTATVNQPTNGLSTSISSANVTCNGGSDGDAAITVSGGTAPYIYNWSNGNITDNNTDLVAGNYTVIVTDANACTMNDSIIITEPTALAYTLQSTSLLCAGGDDGNIEITISGGTPSYSYLWSNGSTDANLYNIPGGIYSVTVTDANNCNIVVSNIELTEPNPVVATIYPQNSTICLNSSQDLMSSVAGGNSPYTYSWNTSETSMNITVSPIDTTEYSLVVTDVNGCISEPTTAIVNVRAPITITATGDEIEICPGDPLNIIVDAQGGNGHYYYTLQDGSMVTDNFVVYPNQTMTYIITVSDDCGSPVGTASVDVTVLENPPLSFIPDVHYGCQPLTVHFSEQSIDEGQTYEWDFGDNSSSNIGTDKNPVHIYNNYGIFDVALTVTSIDGCKSSQHIADLIEVYKLPEAKFNANPATVSVIKPEVSFFNYSIDAKDYYWSFGDGDSSMSDNPIHNYPEIADDYKISLIVVSDKGCRDTTYSSIRVNEVTTIYIPTAFSPDNDGINDEFYAVASGIELDKFNMLIYNRWGEVIFESDDLYKGWNGKLRNGKYASSGTYYWLITYIDNTGIEYKKSGNVTLIK